MTDVEFPTTFWTTIRSAGKDDAMAADRVALRYRPDVVSFLRQRGFSEADSDDLAQDVFLRIFAEKILARAEKERGRFPVAPDRRHEADDRRPEQCIIMRICGV